METHVPVRHLDLYWWQCKSNRSLLMDVLHGSDNAYSNLTCWLPDAASAPTAGSEMSQTEVQTAQSFLKLACTKWTDLMINFQFRWIRKSRGILCDWVHQCFGTSLFMPTWTPATSMETFGGHFLVYTSWLWIKTYYAIFWRDELPFVSYLEGAPLNRA